MVAVPARHPLLRHKRIPLEEVLRHPLVLCDPQVCEGYARQVDRVLRRADLEPLIAERVASFDLMMALVAAGFALGLAGAPHITGSREPDDGFVAAIFRWATTGDLTSALAASASWWHSKKPNWPVASSCWARWRRLTCAEIRPTGWPER